MQRLSIAHVVTRYLRGGSERRIHDFIQSLPEASHLLLAGGESDLGLARSQLAPTGVLSIPDLVRDPHPVRDGKALVQIEGALRRGRFDLVVTHQSKAGVLGRVAAWSLRVPCIHSLSMASFGPGYPPWQDRLYRKIERRLSAVTDSYAVVGHDLARRYASIGVPTEKLSVVRSGVPLPSNSPDPAERVATRAGLGLPIGRPVVLSIGSLDSRKNVLLLPQLMEAVHHLVPMDIAPYLAVAGEGPLRERLIRSIEASGLSADACLLGYVTEPNHLIACVDVVVLLSRAEGVSQVLVQAAAAGTPFVAFDVDGVNELLRLGATGACVSFGSVSEAAAAVAKEIVDRPVASTPPDLSSWDRDQIRSAYRELVGRILPDLREIPEDKIA